MERASDAPGGAGLLATVKRGAAKASRRRIVTAAGLAALVAAREFDQQYEWSAHEPAALRAGVEQSVIDAIKFNRALTGVPEKDATLIRLGRAIFRDHTVSSELWAQMEKLFGRQGAVEVTMVMADYAMVGFVLTAVDQQLPADRKPLLPPR